MIGWQVLTKPTLGRNSPSNEQSSKKAYEALQAEEKKKQRKAPPAAQKTRLAYTSPWQAVINWARGATGGSTPAAPINVALPPVSINPTPSPTNPNRPLLQLLRQDQVRILGMI